MQSRGARARAPLLVPGLSGPIQDRDEEGEVAFDDLICHGPHAVRGGNRSQLRWESVAGSLFYPASLELDGTEA